MTMKAEIVTDMIDVEWLFDLTQKMCSSTPKAIEKCNLKEMKIDLKKVVGNRI